MIYCSVLVLSLWIVMLLARRDSPGPVTAVATPRGMSPPGANVMAGLALVVLITIARCTSATTIRERKRGCADLGAGLCYGQGGWAAWGFLGSSAQAGKWGVTQAVSSPGCPKGKLHGWVSPGFLCSCLAVAGSHSWQCLFEMDVWNGCLSKPKLNVMHLHCNKKAYCQALTLHTPILFPPEVL